MIYTVTLNPSLDYVMQVNKLQFGLTNRSTKEELYVGGKGINVSLLLKQLGQSTTVLGFIAGFTGDTIQKELEQLEIPTQLVALQDGLSRINVKLKGQQETEINGCGPTVNEDDFLQLLSGLKEMSEQDILILSGSIPAGLAPDCYVRMMEIAIAKGARVVVDTAGENLRQCLPFRPFLIKPNRQEVEELLSLSIDPSDNAQLADAARQLQQAGAQNVLISLGGDGAFLLDQQGITHRMAAAKGTPLNTVGAGDSMIAGFVTAIVQNKNYADALRLATACGGATAFSQGIADAQTVNQVLSALPTTQN